MKHTSAFRWIAALAPLLLLTGCGELDGVRTDDLPKSPPPDRVEEKVRLLAAIIDRPGAKEDEQWFFKLSAPVKDVAPHDKAFVAFLQSLKFTGKDDAPIDWTKPDGWEHEAGKGLRFATFHLGPKDKSPVVTVSKFDRISSVTENVKRWCRTDLGRALQPAEWNTLRPVKTADGHEAVLVDLKGPGVPKEDDPHAGMGMGLGKAKGKLPDRPRTPRKLPITYTVPGGWTETGPRGGFVPVLTAFRVGDADGRTEATVLTLRGETGDLLANVNRWRGQAGLKPVERVDRPATLPVDGTPGDYFDFRGDKLGMLLVTVRRDDETWYFKLFGAVDVVSKNKDAFESFIKSVKFTGGR